MDEATDLARLLAGARERAGASQAAFATTLGVDRGVLRKIEAGHDPRLSTLAALSCRWPGLSPEALLNAPAGRTPPALEAAWRASVEIHGAMAGRTRVTVRSAGAGSRARIIETSGLRCMDGSAADSQRLAALSMILRGSREVIARLLAHADPWGRTHVFEDAGGRHEVRLPRRGSLAGLSHVRVTRSSWDPRLLEAPSAGPAEALALGTCLVLEHPVERLEFEIAGMPERCEPRLMAWVPALPPEDGERDLAPALHDPDAVKLSRRGGVLKVVVVHPLPGLVHAIGWRERAPSRRRRARATEGGVARALSDARRAAGLSTRALAESVGVSAMTVLEAERGRDLRRSTARLLLEALPDLSPWALVPPSREVELQRDALWAYQQALHGCAVDEDLKSIVVDADGNASITITTRQLRRHARTDRPFHVRLGYAAPQLQVSRASLREVRTQGGPSSDDVRIAPVLDSEGERLHRLIIPPAMAARGAIFTRRLVHPGVYTLTLDRARARTGLEGPFFEGASHAPFVPTRKLVLTVSLPTRPRAGSVRAHAWCAWRSPDPASPDLTARLHPEGLRPRVSRDGRVMSLQVDEALVGVKYAIGWELG